MTKAGRVAIAFVLDKSGSMNAVRESTISGFNEFLEDQKRQPGEALFSLTLFDTAVIERAVAVPLASVEPLTPTSYTPYGNTALYDAVCTTIDTLGNRLKKLPEGERPESVLFVVQTDGQENSSRTYKFEDVQKRIDLQTNRYKWTFLYLGADQDAWAIARTWGIARGNTMSYTNDHVQTMNMYANVSAAATLFRSVPDADKDALINRHGVTTDTRTTP